MASRAFTILPYNRLANAVDTPTGDKADSLIKNAQDRVTALLPQMRAHVSDLVEQLLRLALASDDVLLVEIERVGALALSIAELAGAADMAQVGEIARGISAMTLQSLADGARGRAALRLHLQALSHAASNPDNWPQTSQLMLSHLQTMRRAIGLEE